MLDEVLGEVLDEEFGWVVTDGVEGFEEHAASRGEANAKATAATTTRPAVFMGHRVDGGMWSHCAMEPGPGITPSPRR